MSQFWLAKQLSGEIRHFPIGLLRHLVVFAQDKVQVTMLMTWLVEIWLNQLGKVADQIESPDSKLTQDREIMQEEFRLFLANSNIRVRCLALLSVLSVDAIVDILMYLNATTNKAHVISVEIFSLQ